MLSLKVKLSAIKVHDYEALEKLFRKCLVQFFIMERKL